MPPHSGMARSSLWYYRARTVAVVVVVAAGTLAATADYGQAVARAKAPLACMPRGDGGQSGLRVCSHSLTATDLPGLQHGSLAAMAAFAQANVSCYDFDTVMTQDGVLLQSHPSRYADVGLTKAQVEGMTLAAVRAAGATAAAFPTLANTLEAASRLPHDTTPTPFFMLDVKTPGVAAQVEALRLAERAGVLARTMLYVEADAKARARPRLAYDVDGDTEADFARLLRASAGASCAGRDRGTPLAPGQGASAAREADAMLRWRANGELGGSPVCATMSVSFKLDTRALDAFHDADPKLIVWVVDDDEALARAAAHSVDVVISNRPLRIYQSIVALPKCSPDALRYWRARIVP